jgi:hypothetical protein
MNKFRCASLSRIVATRSPSRVRPAGRLSLIVGSLALLVLCGCGPKRIRADFRNYEAAYAESSNRQLLLNLARLKNHDPAYFFKMGQITSAYRMQGAVTGTGQMTSSSSAVQIPNGGGSTGLIYENDPTFQFIPVNDDTNARLLLEPIQPETFDALYQQGWRLDQLFRLLVDRIEITRPVPAKDPMTGKTVIDCEVETIRNVPPFDIGHPSRDDQDQLSSYVTFLRVSALVYELQRQGHLILGETETFKPYDYAILPAAKDSDADKKDGANGNDRYRHPMDPGGANSAATPSKPVMEASDLEAAVDKNNLWRQTPQGWQLGHKVFTPVFYLTPMKPIQGTQGYIADVANIAPDVHMIQLTNGNALENALAVLANGFSIQTQDSQQDTQARVCAAPQPAAPAGTSGATGSGSDSASAPSLSMPVTPPGSVPQVAMSAKLILRSILAVMAAAAEEQQAFDNLQDNNPCVPESKYDVKALGDPPQHSCENPGPDDPRRFIEEVPPIEQIPLLRLSWNETSGIRGSPLVAVNYDSRNYLIADGEDDPKYPTEIENQYWNRDMFRLINALASQVTVDISKFPLPEILQLHSD